MEKRLKYYLILIVLFSIIGGVGAQQKTIKYEGGRKKTITQKMDSLLSRDTVFQKNTQGKIDTLIIRKTLSLKDSTIQLDRISESDSLIKRDSIIQVEFVKTDSTLITFADLSKKGKLKLEEKNVEEKKFSFKERTLPIGRVSTLSLIPGFGQTYNKQYWKVPVIYGAMGGFIAGGLISSNRHKDYKAEWQRTVNMHLPQSQQDAAFDKMNREGTTRTIYYSAAAAVYMYQIADATFNYKGTTNHIRKATTLATVFPGAGFIYTRTYWRLPIYYGGFATMATVVDYNNRYYQRFAQAYNAMTDSDPTTIVEKDLLKQSPEMLKNARNAARRNRDLGIISIVGIYLLSIVDTHVIATLKNWDMDPNLDITIEPIIINNTMNRGPIMPSGTGLSLKIKF